MSILSKKAPKRKLLLEWNENCGMDENGQFDEIERDIEWEDLNHVLSEILSQMNPCGYWKCEVQNFGWRNVSGFQFVQTIDGEELLRKILPKTECFFKIFKEGNMLVLQNFHHDSPVGNEHYYIKKVSKRDFNKE